MSNDPFVQRAKAMHGAPTIGPGGIETAASILGAQDRIRREQDRLRAQDAQSQPVGTGDPKLDARLSIEKLVQSAEDWVATRKAHMDVGKDAPLSASEQVAYRSVRHTNEWRWAWLAVDGAALSPADTLPLIRDHAAIAYGPDQAEAFINHKVARLAELDNWAQENDAAIKRFELAHVEAFKARIAKTQRRNRIILGVSLVLLVLFVLPIGKMLP